MDSYRRSKAQSILEKHINALGSTYEKKEAEQKILDQKIQLDTLSSMYRAIGLYKFLGFVVTTPY